jgi:uncharacterized sulfatase
MVTTMRKYNMQEPRQPPNFVFIMTDTQGTNIVGAYGHPELNTPNIDGLAANGVRFERAYTTCPLCTPARAGIFSGIYSNLSGPWANNQPFGDTVKTMGQRFTDNGYRTAYVGKWHLDGHDYFGTGICPDGWDDAYWYDARRYLGELNAEQALLWRSGLTSVEQLRAHEIGPDFTMAHRVTNRAVDFLHSQTGGPYLLVVSYDEPHHPFTCPPEYAERYLDYAYPVGLGASDDLSDKPAHHREWARGHRRQVGSHLNAQGDWHDPLYFGCNSFVDAEIGRVIEAAHAHENTYILFTSDHGAMIGAHQLHDKGPAMYEEITHIPLIIEPPQAVRGGIVSSTLVSHIDLLPTMLELAGLGVPPIMAGQSLIPLLSGQGELERSVMIEFNRFGVGHEYMGGLQPIRCVVEDHYKLVINLLYTDELYDLNEDPAEVNNLIAHPDYADIRNRLHDRLLDKMQEDLDTFRGPCWERRPWRDSTRFPWAGGTNPLAADGYRPKVFNPRTGSPVD